MTLTWAEMAAVPLSEQPIWPDCGHRFRPFQTMTEYRDFMGNHRGGLCDPTTCHWCRDEQVRDPGWTLRGIDGPQLSLGL